VVVHTCRNDEFEASLDYVVRPCLKTHTHIHTSIAEKQSLERRNANGQKQFMKNCSTLLIIRQMQIKTIVKYHLTPFRMVVTKKAKIPMLAKM
jgi:hypothetical protein